MSFCHVFTTPQLGLAWLVPGLLPMLTSPLAKSGEEAALADVDADVALEGSPHHRYMASSFRLHRSGSWIFNVVMRAFLKLTHQ